jgi:hypothetical protein
LGRLIGGHHRRQWIWAADSISDVRRFLNIVRPYVQVKKKQVQLMDRYLSMVGINGERVKLRRLKMAKRMHELNAKRNQPLYWQSPQMKAKFPILRRV